MDGAYPSRVTSDPVAVEGADDVLDLDDVPLLAPAPRRPGAGPRSRLLAVLCVVVVLAGLAVAQRVETARQSRVELVASSGQLLVVRQPSSADYNTLVAVSVELRNEGPVAITLRSVSTSGPGVELDDDLSGSGGAARGLEQGTRLEPRGLRRVVLAGVLVCPDTGELAPVIGDLVVTAAAGDGTERTVDVAAPRTEDWTGAVARACSLIPARR